MKNKKNTKKRELYDYDSEKVKKKTKKGKHSIEQKKDEDINSENEIIIGVTEYPNEKNKQKVNKKSNKETNKKQENNKKQKKKVKIKEKVENEKIEKKDNKRLSKILKWTGIFFILVGATAFAMLSPIFNIKGVIVTGNENISTETVISLSNIKIGENIFRINKNKIVTNIKENGYVETLNVKRKLPNKIEINITERKTNFIIECGNGYAYINNQGYILDISSEKKNVPLLQGISTDVEQLVEGKRLNSDDLKKMGTVLNIINIAQVNEIVSLITAVDISNKEDYVLFFESEQKKAYLGDGSDLETKIIYLTAILKSEEGIPGEIFLNMNLNNDDAFFRQSV